MNKKYRVELWQYGCLRGNFGTDDYEEAKNKLKSWYDMYDEYGHGYTTVYIDEVQVSAKEKFRMMGESYN